MDLLVQCYLGFPKEVRHEYFYKLCDEKIRMFDIENKNILEVHHNITKEPWHEKIFHICG